MKLQCTESMQLKLTDIITNFFFEQRPYKYNNNSNENEYKMDGRGQLNKVVISVHMSPSMIRLFMS
jgi:hypothetical protein